jgi:ribosomal protein S18 acetylase RimI-like enzyme
MGFLRATPAQDDIVVRHYLAIWDSYDTPASHFDVEPEDKVRRFIEEGRERRQLATFLAFDGDTAAGSVSCQIHLSPYPEVLRPAIHRHGYIWSVYVEPSYRRQGVSRQLT